jgi:pimeloyl-ACP methyl ester carboxylesterase
VITFDNRGIGASSGAPATSIEQMATDAITFIKAMAFERGGPLLRVSPAFAHRHRR